MAVNQAGVLALTALAVAGVASANRSRRRARKKTPSKASPKVLELAFGPVPDPCLQAVYSRQALPLRQDIFTQLNSGAQALYGQLPVYFLTEQAQADAFMRAASLRVNEPQTEPVIKTLQELAPECEWLVPEQAWTPSMKAMRDSVERMVQIVDADSTGIAPRPQAWMTNYPILRDTEQLNLVENDAALFELPPGVDPSTVSATITRPWGDLVDGIEPAGIVQYPLRVSAPNEEPAFEYRPMLVLYANVPGTYKLAASSPTEQTLGTIKVQSGPWLWATEGREVKEISRSDKDPQFRIRIYEDLEVEGGPRYFAAAIADIAGQFSDRYVSEYYDEPGTAEGVAAEWFAAKKETFG